MNNKRTKTRSVLNFALVFMYIFCFVFALPISAAAPSYLSITNDSSTVFSRGTVRIELKDTPNGSYNLDQEGDTKTQVDSCVITTNKSNWLYLSSNLNANEEKIFRIEEQKKNGENFLPLSTDPGTEFHFVNFEKAYIVSCEHDNTIQVFSNKDKILEEFSLNKGNSYVYRSSNPQNIILKSSKPCFVFESSISDDQIKQKESGDSDTTTLFGNHLFFFNPAHLWVSAYENDTKVKILDENQSMVKEFTIQPDEGIFIDDLDPAAYSLISSSNVTAQFGYLDNENYSFVIGQKNKVNGYSFGDLLFYSPFDNVDIKIQFKEEKENFSLKAKGDTKVISLVENFSPSVPESTYFTATSNKPFFVVTYSSGNNFGGEFIPGNHGTYYDSNFIAISSRISKEFSKDQKNLLEFYSQKPYTNLSIKTSNEKDSQNVELSEYSIYDYLSVNPLEKITITADETILSLQLHNYTSKGMFYYVPPVSNNITYEFSNTPSNNGGIFVNNSSNILSFKTFTNPLKWQFFISSVKNKNAWPFTTFFGAILLLLLILLLANIFKDKDGSKDIRKDDSKQSSKEIKLKKNELPNNSNKKEVKVKIKESVSTNIEPETFVKSIIPEVTETSSKKRKMRIDPSIRTEWIDEEDDNEKEVKVKIDAKSTKDTKETIDNNEPLLRKNKKNKNFNILVPTINKINVDSELPSLKADEDSLLKEFRIKKHKPLKVEPKTNTKNIYPLKVENKVSSIENIEQPKRKISFTQRDTPEKDRLIETLKTGSKNTDKKERNNTLIEKAFQNNTKNNSTTSELFDKNIVVDPGSANRLYIEGLISKFNNVYIATSSSKKLNNEVTQQVKQIKLNANDVAKASTMSDSFSTFEEAGKAFVVCKKKHIRLYVSSYKLPKRLGNISIVSVHDILNTNNKKK